MLNFFETIVEYVKIAFGFLLNMFETLINLFSVLTDILALPPVLYLYAPAFLATSVSIVTAIGVLKLIIGRDQG